jgi:hypothetical protein
MSYSPYIETLHDERAPAGHSVHGTHYSILRVPIWQKTLPPKVIPAAWA